MKDWRWDNFTPKEVLSPDGLALLRKNNLTLQGHALDRLQWYREFLKAPLSINHAGLKYRGFRSWRENKKIGGAEGSKHCFGLAFDMNCYSASTSAFTVATVAYSIEQIKKNKTPHHRGFRGIGVYPKKNFVHGDFRSFAAQNEDYLLIWNGDAGGLLVLHEKDFPTSLTGILALLKRELNVPHSWSL